LPTVHGFDEFFGNLYHLNAEEEPENPDYPKPPQYPNFHAKFGPRGVLHSFASDKDDPTEDPRFGRVGKQTIEDTGPLTKKRMETRLAPLLKYSIAREPQGPKRSPSFATRDALSHRFWHASALPSWSSFKREITQFRSAKLFSE
jgi:arylsulfatase A-like enzyme